MQKALNVKPLNGTPSRFQMGVGKVVKRDGREELFNHQKIVDAVTKCLQSVWSDLPKAEKVAAEVSKAVLNILLQHGDNPTVERIQELVIQQLWVMEHTEAATAYTLYREQRRKDREMTHISPEVAAAVAEDAKHFPTPLQYYQFISKFSRWKEDVGRRETWREACRRVMDWFAKSETIKLDAEEWQMLYSALYNMEATCALRVLQMAGPALDRCNIGVYNCAYAPIIDLFSFAELLYVLMQGSGMGFSVEYDYISQLPRIKKQKTVKKAVKHKFKVEDSTEGWCDAYYFGLKAWFAGEDVEYDTSAIRPAGARLKTKGGQASGPGPLIELLSFARNLILSRQNGYLADIDVHDLCCVTGKIVQVGGVRRASCISLSDLDSMSMRSAKDGQWYEKAVYRTMSNNSAVYEEKPDAVEFMEEWLALAKSGSGERGIFNRYSVLKHLPARRKKCKFGVNPCSEIIERPHGLCNLSIAVARPDDTEESLMRKVTIATYFGVMQSTYTDFKYVRPEWKKNCIEERLLGVDITAHADCPLLRYGAPGRSELLKRLKAQVAKTRKMLAARFGIAESTADTCVKPAGDSAVLFNCGSGISAWHDEFVIRNVRESMHSPVCQLLKDAGVPWAVAPEDPSLVVFSFLRKAPKGATLRNDLTAIQQLENWLDWRLNWAEHTVSCTVYVEPHEWFEAGNWVLAHFDDVSGLSFLPKDNGIYRYAPNESCTEEEYNKRMAEFPIINWAKLSRYEKEDKTTSSQTYACTGDRCERV